ncbi:MAG: hypothetical protein JRI23_35810 [Deltaproteobacteria bacterium]|nr:hypothetical protein [Deltaproteobacteria bacterium]MBW2537707.1 hypothetical protein [Deltaproteobacteria bacterium]
MREGDGQVGGRISWRAERVTIVLFALILIAALALVATKDFMQLRVDDAYISFQYAKSLVEGDGLVFNPGERVEGYTNFVWVMAAAAVMLFVDDPCRTLQWISTGLLGALVVLFFFVHRACLPKDHTKPFRSFAYLLGLPLLFPHYVDANLFGLELPLYAVLIPLFGYVLLLCPATSRRRVVLTTIVGLTLLLTRMDGLLFVGLGMVVFALQQLRTQDGWRRAAHVVVGNFGALAMLYGLYLAWKWLYYGDLLPNTYYAKAAYEWKVELGLSYLREFTEVHRYTVLALVPFILIAAGWGFLAIRRRHAGDRRRWFIAFLGLSLLAYLAYVVKVGGDFMAYRFIYHVLPVVAVLCWFGVQRLVRSRLVVGTVLSVALPAAIGLVPLDTEAFYAANQMQGVADMNRYFHHGRDAGPWLAKRLPAETFIAARLAGTVRFFSELRTLDMWGLNDRQVARQKPNTPFRGHNKHASERYLRERGVNLIVYHPVTSAWNHPRDFAEARFPSVFIRTSGNRALRSHYLIPTPELTKLFVENPSVFKLRHVPDHMLHRGPFLYAFEDGRLPPNAVTQGTAFAHGPTRGQIGGQQRIPNYQGCYVVNSFHPTERERATGTLVLSPLVLDGRYLNFHLGGGPDEQRLRVVLSEGDQELRRAVAKGVGPLRHIRWDLSSHRGRELTLSLVDESSKEGSGYLVADAFYATD